MLKSYYNLPGGEEDSEGEKKGEGEGRKCPPSLSLLQFGENLCLIIKSFQEMVLCVIPVCPLIGYRGKEIDTSLFISATQEQLCIVVDKCSMQ